MKADFTAEDARTMAKVYGSGRVYDMLIALAERIEADDGSFEPVYTHSARSGVVSDEDVEAVKEFLDKWPYINCVCGRTHQRMSQEMRAALEHFAKGSGEDVRDAPELFSGTKDALSNLSIHKSYQEKTA